MSSTDQAMFRDLPTESGEIEDKMTLGPSHLIKGLEDYQPTGQYRIPTPSTYSTAGMNLWPLSSSLLTHP